MQLRQSPFINFLTTPVIGESHDSLDEEGDLPELNVQVFLIIRNA